MTTPGYNPNIPNPKDKINASQTPFLDNFKTLFDAYAVNHTSLDATVDIGYHTKLELPQQTETFQTSAGEISLYSRQVTNQPSETDKTVQLFFRYQGNPSEFRYTNYQIYTLKDIVNANGSSQTRFITFLPNNIIIIFGKIDTKRAVGTLVLEPYVIKNILAVNFCPIDILDYPPGIEILGSNGIYTGITVGFNSSGAVGVAPQYYMVVGQT